MAIKDTHGGHYGANMMDPGAVGCGYKEAVVAHEINELIRKYTGAPDTSDYSANNVPQNLSNIVSNMNRYAGDWHISNHLNAFNGQANGVEVWYYAGDSVAGEMATKVSAAIAKATGLYNRGAKATTNLYVISNSVGRALLVEWAFIDNQGDMNKLMPNLDNAVRAVVNCFGYNAGNVPVQTAKPEPQKQIIKEERGGATMVCTYQYEGVGAIWYFDGKNVTVLAHEDEWEVLKMIYKANNGKELPHFIWTKKAPFNARLENMAKRAVLPNTKG